MALQSLALTDQYDDGSGGCRLPEECVTVALGHNSLCRFNNTVRILQSEQGQPSWEVMQPCNLLYDPRRCVTAMAIISLDQ